MATVSEFLDLLRSKLGVPDIDPFQLKTIAAWGRRELESRGNYYYSIGLKDHTLTASTQTYSLTSASGTGMGLTSFKEAHSLFIRDVAGQSWIPLPIGAWEGFVDHAHSTSGKPQVATIHNETLYMFPVPSDVYPVRLIYFDWTTNPAAVTGTDELLTNWDQALFYASMMAGKRFLTESLTAGDTWERLMDEQVERLKDFTNKRLKDAVNSMSTREAAQILQASGGQQQ